MEYFRRCKENLMLMTSPSSNHWNGDQQCQLRGKRIMWRKESGAVQCAVFDYGRKAAVLLPYQEVLNFPQNRVYIQ